MKQKTFIILFLLVVVCGGASLLLRRESSRSWQNRDTQIETKILGNFPLNEVKQIVITTGTNELNLVKKGDSWMVRERNYPADFELVSRMIRTLWELKAVQDLNVGPSQLARLELVEPAAGSGSTGMLIDLKDVQNKRTAALLLGKNYLKSDPGVPGEGFPAGRYVMPLDGKTRVALVEETFSGFNTNPENWIDHSFIRLAHIKSVALTGTTPGMQWKLQRDNEKSHWQLCDSKPDEYLNTAQVPIFASSLEEPSFTDVLLPDTKPETLGLNHPVVLVIETFDGFTYTLKAGAPGDGNYPLTVSVSAILPPERKPGTNDIPEEKLTREKKLEGRIFLVPRYTIDSLLKERSSLVSTPNPSPGPSPAVPDTQVPAK